METKEDDGRKDAREDGEVEDNRTQADHSLLKPWPEGTHSVLQVFKISTS